MDARGVEVDLQRSSLVGVLAEEAVRARLTPRCASLRLSNNYLERFALCASPALPTLTSIDLTCNELECMPDISAEAVPALRRLCLSNNRIRSMAPAAAWALPRLEELYLQHNRIDALLALPGCSAALVTLSLSCNPVAAVEPCAAFPRLRRLGLFGHLIPELAPIESLAARCPELRRLTVAAGACTHAGAPGVPRDAAQREWRRRLLAAQPRLRWLECEYVGASERAEVAREAAEGEG